MSRLLLKHSERTRNKSELFYRNIMFGMKDIEYKKNHFSNARQEQTKRKEQKEFLGGGGAKEMCNDHRSCMVNICNMMA